MLTLPKGGVSLNQGKITMVDSARDQTGGSVIVSGSTLTMIDCCRYKTMVAAVDGEEDVLVCSGPTILELVTTPRLLPITASV